MQNDKFDLVEAKHPQADDHLITAKEEALALLKEEARSKQTLKRLWATWERVKPTKSSKKPVENDRDLLKALADEIARGRLRRKKVRTGFGSVSAVQKQPPAPQLQTTWAPDTSLKIRERPDPEPPRPPAPETDVAQQIRALQAAADSGAAFCEQCQE